jgi:hypothetical protein
MKTDLKLPLIIFLVSYLFIYCHLSGVAQPIAFPPLDKATVNKVTKVTVPATRVVAGKIEVHIILPEEYILRTDTNAYWTRMGTDFSSPLQYTHLSLDATPGEKKISLEIKGWYYLPDKIETQKEFWIQVLIPIKKNGKKEARIVLK